MPPEAQLILQNLIETSGQILALVLAAKWSLYALTALWGTRAINNVIDNFRK
jgi:hypothetical protein